MTTSKQSKNMSLAVDSDIQDRLKKVAKQRDTSVSKLIRDILVKHLGADVEDGVVVDTVILKIPASLKANSEELKKWLQVRCDSIVKAMSN